MATFRERLLAELAKRRAVNARYSLRAFAALLGADHATVSQILRGKRSAPLEQMGSWARKLNMSDEEVAVYEAVARVLDEEALAAQDALRRWAGEMLCLLTQAEHRKILQLVRDPSFRKDSRWLADAAGVSVDAVNVALTRMLRLGILEISPHGVWQDATGLTEIDARSFRRYVAERMPDPLQREKPDGKPGHPIPDPVQDAR